jgi:hypothetical protein
VTLPQGPISSGVPVTPALGEVDNETATSARSFLLLMGSADDEMSIPDQTFEGYNDEISVSILSASVSQKSDTKSKQSLSTNKSKDRRVLHSQSSALSATSVSSSVGGSTKERKENQRLQAILNTKKQFWMTSFRYCRYATSVYQSPEGQSYRWGGLSPHPLLTTWSYRDALIHRRLDEQWAARKIQTFYHFVMKYRHLKAVNTAKTLQRWFRRHRQDWQLGEIKDRLYVLSCALKIQRHFRQNLLPLLRHTLKIQKLVRGWRGRIFYKKLLQKHLAAKSIQKIARGMVVRLSDRYILTQIYMKLPPFWKTVIHSCAPDDDDGDDTSGGTGGKILKQFGRFVSHQIYSDHTKHYQILKTTRDVRAMITGIESNRQVIPDVPSLSSGNAMRTINLAPKLPFIVPQSFDKKPYVSRADGRKLAFYTGDDALLKKDLPHDVKAKSQSLYASQAALTFGLENLKSKSLEKDIHQYTFTFWPLASRPPQESVGDTTLFNPMLNGFEVRQNLKETLHCELCGLRLRLIFCHICCKGFCFFCAFKAHLDGTKRNHRMDMMEPRVVQVKEADTSLVYHLDMVQKTTYDIK